MYNFRITLRFILGTVTTLYIITFLFQIFNNGVASYAEYLLIYSIIYFQIPAILILLIVSIYSYLTRGILWSLFKTEYFFLFASLCPFIICWLFYVVWPYLTYYFTIKN